MSQSFDASGTLQEDVVGAGNQVPRHRRRFVSGLFLLSRRRAHRHKPRLERSDSIPSVPQVPWISVAYLRHLPKVKVSQEPRHRNSHQFFDLRATGQHLSRHPLHRTQVFTRTKRKSQTQLTGLSLREKISTDDYFLLVSFVNLWQALKQVTHEDDLPNLAEKIELFQKLFRTAFSGLISLKLPNLDTLNYLPYIVKFLGPLR